MKWQKRLSQMFKKWPLFTGVLTLYSFQKILIEIEHWRVSLKYDRAKLTLHHYFSFFSDQLTLDKTPAVSRPVTFMHRYCSGNRKKSYLASIFHSFQRDRRSFLSYAVFRKCPPELMRWSDVGKGVFRLKLTSYQLVRIRNTTERKSIVSN